MHDDTWLALVAGREVAQHGIPAHETLTIAAFGRRWIDQQWLAQLSMYELDRVGGIALVGFVEVTLVARAVGEPARLGDPGRCAGQPPRREPRVGAPAGPARLALGLAKPVGLLLGAPLCLLANPYGPAVASYCRAPVFNTELRKLTSEWQPVTHEPAMTIVLLLLLALAGWSLVRHRRRSTPWERAALLLLAIGAAVAVRNVPWFALAALVLLPVWIAPAARLPAWLTRWSWLLAAGVAAFGALWLLQGAIIAFTRTAAAQAPGNPAGALAACVARWPRTPPGARTATTRLPTGCSGSCPSCAGAWPPMLASSS